MSVGWICTREVHLADPDETVKAAAERMRSRNVGTLVVLDPANRPIGIVTDRDLVLRVVATGRSPAITRVADVMTERPKTVTEGTSLREAVALMKSGGFRRVPVVGEGGALIGLLSLDDFLDLIAEEFALVGQLLSREGPAKLGPDLAHMQPRSVIRPRPPVPEAPGGRDLTRHSTPAEEENRGD